MSEKKIKVAFCSDCSIFFKSSPEEQFLEESFCPICSGRSEKEFTTLGEARKECGRLPVCPD